jgi:nucleoside-diphosphate-sugar epimerase
MSGRYFVTGATGFIGGRIVRQLRDAGHTVVALVRDPARAADLAQQGVILHRGDITDRATLRAPMQGADGVFHVAAWYELGSRDRAHAEAINVGGTRNVLETMRDLGIARGVYTSSVAVFGNTGSVLPDETYRRGGPWLTLYDRTKWHAHYEVAEPLMQAGLPLIVVQPGLVYGPGDHSIVRRTFVQYLRGKLRATPRGTRYCFGFVDDIAQAHIQAMLRGRPGECYIVAGPAHDFIEVFDLAARITGIPAPKLHPGPNTMRLLADVMSVVAAAVDLPPDYHPESLRVIAGVSYAGSDAKARRELGFTPRPLLDGLRTTLHHEMQLLGMPIPP